MRSNPNPDPPRIVDNINTIFRGSEGIYAISGTPLHTKSLSSEVLRSLEDKNLMIKFRKPCLGQKVKNN